MGQQAVGVVAIAGAILAFGSFGVPIKSERLQRSQARPMFSQRSMHDGMHAFIGEFCGSARLEACHMLAFVPLCKLEHVITTTEVWGSCYYDVSPTATGSSNRGASL
jgi:hypothetical protein